MQAGLRPALRSLRFSARRANSSASSPQQSEAVQKAVQGATNAYNQGAAALGRVAGPVGARVSSSLGSLGEPLIFSAKTFASMFRQVYKAEKLSFPTDLNTWVTAYSQIIARGTSGKWWTETLKTGAWAGVGVAVVETYGIFKLGEMIGRRNLVGYKLKDN